MNLNIKNKVAVVLAGSAGLGKGVAKVLASEGCRVAICSRSDKKLATAEAEIKEFSFGNSPLTYSADVSYKDQLHSFLDAVFAEYGSIDILVNNAGGPPPGGVISLNEAAYDMAYQLTLMSAVRATRYAIPLMEKNKWGRIIFLTSTGVKSAIDGLLLSNVFRSAVAGFAKSVAGEVAHNGIRIHNVLTGPFYTERVIELGNAAAKTQGISFKNWKKVAEENTMLGRFGDPLEMGYLITFLASDLSAYMTGTTIAIDGGALKTIS